MKKGERIRLIIFLSLAIALLASLAFNVFTEVKISKINKDYEKLSANYESMGKEMLAEKNAAKNLQKTVDELSYDNASLLKNIEEYKSALYLAMNDVYLSENHYVSDKSVNILEAVSGDTIKVNTEEYYALYSKNADVYIERFNEDLLLQKSESPYHSGETYFIKFPEECDRIKVTGADSETILVSTGINVSNNSCAEDRYFYVVSDKSPYKLSVSEAVLMVKEHGTVLVFPGVYEENILTRDKEVNILGTDKESCILLSHDNDYYNPVLEISAGSVRNISLRADDDGRGVGSGAMAYAVHADFDYMYGRNLSFDNCVIYSDYNAGAGIGLRGNGTLSFVDCELTGYYHGLFVHDSKETDVGGNQNLIVESCKVTGINGDVAMVISSCVVDEADVNICFKNNELANLYSPESTNLFAAVNEDLSKHEGFYMDLKNFHLDSASGGNNVSAMNFK